MLGGQPGNGWHLSLSLQLHAGGSDFRLYDGFDLKVYLEMKVLGPNVMSVVGPTAFVFNFTVESVSSSLSPFYILICIY